MFLFLLSLTSALTVKEKIDYTGYKYLKSYGLQKGGTIEFQIISHPDPGVIIFVPWLSEFNRIKSSIIKQTSTCHNLEMFQNIEHYTSLEGSLISEVVYVANKTGIKVPIIANCGNQTISISAKYMNPTTYFDTREMYIPVVTTAFSYIYAILTLVWVGNAIAFPRFRIAIHYVFTFTCIVKALALNLSTKKWTTKGLIGKFDDKELIFDTWFSIISNTILFSVNICASSGWGIFRKNISWMEIINGFIHTGLFFIAYSMSKNAETVWTAIIYGFLSFLSCFNYIGDITQGLVLITRLSDDHGNETLKLKLKMAIKYTVTFSTLILLLCLCLFYNIMGSQSATMLRLGEEAMILLIAILDLDSFFIRKSHFPGEEEQDLQTNHGPITPDPESLTLLQEPNGDELAFIANEA